jgi:hypothetical protein
MLMSAQEWQNDMKRRLNKMNCELMLTYDTPALRQTESRNLTGQKTLPTIWGTYMKPVTKYQISAINNCWEKCDEKCGYMINVYKNQLSRQTGSRNLTGPKTLPTIWYTYMTLLTKYQISAINSYWEKCDEKYLGRTEGRTDGQTDRGKTVYPSPPSGSGGIINAGKEFHQWQQTNVEQLPITPDHWRHTWKDHKNIYFKQV